MFNALCEKALHISPRKAKKEVLKLSGSAMELDAYMPTLMNLELLISQFDIKSELKVFYVADDAQKIEVEPDKPEAVKGVMAKQEKEITNPELVEEKTKKIEVVEPPETQTSGDPPDFDF